MNTTTWILSRPPFSPMPARGQHAGAQMQDSLNPHLQQPGRSRGQQISALNTSGTVGLLASSLWHARCAPFLHMMHFQHGRPWSTLCLCPVQRSAQSLLLHKHRSPHGVGSVPISEYRWWSHWLASGTGLAAPFHVHQLHSAAQYNGKGPCTSISSGMPCLEPRLRLSLSIAAAHIHWQ
jgi:hypothetical protein